MTEWTTHQLQQAQKLFAAGTGYPAIARQLTREHKRRFTAQQVKERLRLARKGVLPKQDPEITFSEARELRKLMREHFGVDCPECAVKRPRSDPSRLLPGQRCKVDGYRDPRPRPTQAEIARAFGRVAED